MLHRPSGHTLPILTICLLFSACRDFGTLVPTSAEEAELIASACDYERYTDALATTADAGECEHGRKRSKASFEARCIELLSDCDEGALEVDACAAIEQRCAEGVGVTTQASDGGTICTTE